MKCAFQLGAVLIALPLAACDGEALPFGPSYEDAMTWAEKAAIDLPRARRDSVPSCEAEIERKEEAALEERRRKNERNRALGNGIVSYSVDVLQLCGELMDELHDAGLSDVIDPREPDGVAPGSEHVNEWPPKDDDPRGGYGEL